jgi:hypothetical protein
MDEKLSDVCKAHEKEVADMTAANTVLKAQLEKELSEKEIADMKAANAVLKAQLEKALADSKHMAQVCNTHSPLNCAVH